MDISGVIERLAYGRFRWLPVEQHRWRGPWHSAKSFMGLRYSSSRISPGVIGSSMSMSMSSSITALSACPSRRCSASHCNAASRVVRLPICTMWPLPQSGFCRCSASRRSMSLVIPGVDNSIAQLEVVFINSSAGRHVQASSVNSSLKKIPYSANFSQFSNACG